MGEPELDHDWPVTEGLPWVRRVEHYLELGSTSDVALQLAGQADLELPLLILADRQTAGRGRGANRWWSAEGALTFSLVFSADQLQLAPDCWPQVSITTAMVICQVLNDECPALGPIFGIKWPNDVHGQGRKVAGILVEIPNTRALNERRIVLGVGLNVNNSHQTAPESLRAIATSLSDLSGHKHSRSRILWQLLAGLKRAFSSLSQRDQTLSKRWNEFCLLRGRTVSIDQHGRVVTGVAQEIDSTGALVLQTSGGSQRVVAGTVKTID